MGRFYDFFDEVDGIGNLVNAEAILGERYFQEGYRGKALRRKVRWAMIMIRHMDRLDMADVVPLWEMEVG
jgi:hypothetical protein